MTTVDSTSLPAIRQLSIFDDRPLPLLIAEKWGFVLRTIEGDTLFCVHDWLFGVGLTGSSKKNTSVYIRKLRHQQRFDGFRVITIDDMEYAEPALLWTIAIQGRDIYPQLASLRAAIARYMANPSHGFEIPERIQSTRQHDGYVYLVKSISGQYKIGRTKRPKDRFETFESKFPFEIKMSSLIKTSNARLLENHLHKTFHAFRTDGEWFDLPSNVIDQLPFICELYGDAEILQVEATSKLLGIDIATGQPLLQARTR